MKVENNKKKSLIRNNEGPLFFSLVDYRNNYFTSDDPDKIIEFYNGFENREQLIQWMKERPKGVANVHEVTGDKDIIVVIPTADFNGKYAKECRDNIFKGLHLVFVESGEVPDPYFNYAHNCNVGIKKALKYNPKWIVVSNDDMHKIDEISVLKNELKKLDPEELYMAYASPSYYHSVAVRFSSARLARNYFSLLNFIRSHKNEMTTLKLIRIKSDQTNIENKFSCFYIPNSPRGLSKFIYKKGFNYLCFMDFAIFSSSFPSSFPGGIFDETFINGYEDHDISLQFSLDNRKYAFTNYRIDDYIGSSLGTGISRELRNIASLSFLNYKHGYFASQTVQLTEDLYNNI